MRNLICCVLAICSLLCLSCEDSKVNPDIGFIKAKVNGIETVYKTPPAELDYYNYIKPGAINIRFNKDKISSQTWSIDIYYGHITLDVNNLQLPFTIEGPNPDFAGQSPYSRTTIGDPDGGPYGKSIAEASSFGHKFTLTITSVHNNIIKGTFNGVGYGEFENGEFSARLPVKDW